MRLLLDTHTLLWFLLNDRKLSKLAKVAIEVCDGVLIHSLLGNLKAGDQVITAEPRDTAGARSAVPRPRL